MTADHSVDTALEMGIDSGAGKQKPGLFLRIDDLLASDDKFAGDKVLKPPRQQTVQNPEHWPHALFVCKKFSIGQAQAMAVRDMHPQISKSDISLLSQTCYTKRLKRSGTRKEIAVAVHKTDCGAA
jgi:acid phosphatase class B